MNRFFHRSCNGSRSVPRAVCPPSVLPAISASCLRGLFDELTHSALETGPAEMAPERSGGRGHRTLSTCVRPRCSAGRVFSLSYSLSSVGYRSRCSVPSRGERGGCADRTEGRRRRDAGATQARRPRGEEARRRGGGGGWGGGGAAAVAALESFLKPGRRAQRRQGERDRGTGGQEGEGRSRMRREGCGRGSPLASSEQGRGCACSFPFATSGLGRFRARCL